MATLSFTGLSIEVRASSAPTSRESASGESESYVVLGGIVELTLPRPAISFYRHGWQSWSLACWHDANASVPVQKPTILHPLQTDPRHAHRTDPNGSWVGAVRFDDGFVLLLGALGTDAHVELAAGNLRGTHEDSDTDLAWLLAYGHEDIVFRCYADALADSLGRAPGKPAPRVWCSWYSFYTGITEDAISRVVHDLGDLDFDTIQVDDGWQRAIGDWQPNEKFPSGMPSLAQSIRSTGRRAGLWLAPLIATASSRLVREHRDWLLRDERGRLVSAGFNWGEQLYALDTTNGSALEWLQALMRTVRAWGFDYLKLDFLYGGALPGVRHVERPREAAYRDAIRLMRAAMGDAYFVACAAPIVPSLGLCDALRIGPDVAAFWEQRRDERYLANPSTPGTRNAIRTSVHRLWLAPVVAPDPDVVYISSRWNTLTAAQRSMLHALARICGFVATSDLPSWLESAASLLSGSDSAPDPRESLRHLLSASPDTTRITAYTYQVDGSEVDFAPALGLPGRAPGMDQLLGPVVSWVGNRRAALRVMAGLSTRSAARRVPRLLGNTGKTG
jgi:alpha-galactosidase